MPVHVFHMGMTCEGCAGAAKRVLGKIGVEEGMVRADVEAKEVRVTSDLPREQIEEALKKTGKEIAFKATE